MSMPIQRQSDSFGGLDTGTRFAREYTTRDLPEGLVNALAGPRITAGLNNPRGLRQADAMPAPGMFDKHGPYGSGIDNYAHPSEPDNDPREYADEDPHEPSIGSDGYPNEVGEGDFHEDLGAHEHPDVAGFGFGGYDDYDPHSVENLPPDYEEQFSGHTPSHRDPAGYSGMPKLPEERYRQSFSEARTHTAEDGPAPALFAPNQFRPGERLDANSELLGNDQWMTAAAVSPQVVPGWVGHGYIPGHRVGLPWRDTVIPGTVTHLDGQQVGIRWDDGQHSAEEPSDLRPL